MLIETGLNGAKTYKTRMELSTKFTSKVYDKQTNQNIEDDEIKDPIVFKKLIGKLIYLTQIRLDIKYVVQNLSQFICCPKKSYMDGAKMTVQYLKKKLGMDLLFPASKDFQITTYCDSN